MNASTSQPRLQLVASSYDSEEGLVVRAKRGERGAQEALFHRHAESLRRWVHGIALGTADADDVVQDTFILAFERIGGLSKSAAFRPWLRSIAVSQLRRRFRRTRLLRRLHLIGPSAQVAIPVTANAPPDVVLEAKRLQQLLATLPTDEGLALSLRRVEGLQLSEIAELLGLSVATVKRRLSAAELRLNEQEE